MNWLKRILDMIPLEQLAREELYEAERQLLLAHSSLESARCLVTYNQDRVQRLKLYLKSETLLVKNL